MRDFFYRFRRGSDASELIRTLARESKDGDGSGDVPASTGAGQPGDPQRPGPLTNAEISVLISVDNTLAKRDRRTGAALVKQEKALVEAAHASAGAANDLETARAEPRWGNSADVPAGDRQAVTKPDQDPGPSSRQRRIEHAWRSRGGPSFHEMFDPHEPLINERTLLLVEIIFVVVEFAFWYGVFSDNVNKGVGLLNPDRVSAVLLSVMVPLSGIVTARVIGGLAHRAISRYPGVGQKEYIGAAASAVVAILAIYAIFSLVSTRFSGSQIVVTQLPALAMTLVFIVVLLGDMLARIFLVSEIRAQTKRWLRHLDRLKAAALRANQQHYAAWLNLRNAAQMELDHCERIVAAGARIISDQRSRRRALAPQIPSGSGNVLRQAHDKTPADELSGQLAVPAVLPLQLYDVALALGPIRAVEDAVNTLRALPPLTQRGLLQQLNDMTTRLYRLEGVLAGKPTADPGEQARNRENCGTQFPSPPTKQLDQQRQIDDVNGAGPAPVQPDRRDQP